MAVYTDQIGILPQGVGVPGGWTARYGTSGVVYTVTDSAAAPGGKKLNIQHTANGPRMISLDALNGDGDRATIDMLALVRLNMGQHLSQGQDQCGLCARAAGAVGNEVLAHGTYFAKQSATPDTDQGRLRVRNLDSGAGSNVVLTNADAWQKNDTQWVRVRINGTNLTIDNYPENDPLGTPIESAATTAIAATGTDWAGLFSFGDNLDIDILYLAIGTGADSAPLPAAALSNAAGAATGPGSATGTVDCNMRGGTLYSVITDSPTKPSASQVMAGEDHTGTTAAYTTNQTVDAAGEQGVETVGGCPARGPNDFYFDFESGKLPAELACSGNCPTVIDTDARSGTRCMQARWNSSMSNPKRAEVVLSSGQKNMEWGRDYWFGYSSKVLPNFSMTDYFEIASQIHNSYSGDGTPFRIQTQMPPNQQNSRQHLIGDWVIAMMGTYVSGGKIVPGEWKDWVVHYVPSQGNDGVCQVWADGELKLDYTGPTAGSSSPDGPYFKWGVYKSLNETRERTVLYDAIRVASGPTAKYDDVAFCDGSQGAVLADNTNYYWHHVHDVPQWSTQSAVETSNAFTTDDISEGVGTVSGGGGITANGATEHRGVGAVSGGGSIAAAGDSVFEGVGLVTGGGAITGTGYTSHGGVGTVSGGGLILGLGDDLTPKKNVNAGDRIYVWAKAAAVVRRDYEGTFHAFCDAMGVPAGDFNERMILWLQDAMDTTIDDLSSLQAMAAGLVGACSWDGVGLNLGQLITGRVHRDLIGGLSNGTGVPAGFTARYAATDVTYTVSADAGAPGGKKLNVTRSADGLRFLSIDALINDPYRANIDMLMLVRINNGQSTTAGAKKLLGLAARGAGTAGDETLSPGLYLSIASSADPDNDQGRLRVHDVENGSPGGAVLSQSDAWKKADVQWLHLNVSGSTMTLTNYAQNDPLGTPIETVSKTALAANGTDWAGIYSFDDLTDMDILYLAVGTGGVAAPLP